MRNYQINLVIEVNETSVAREPEYKVSAQNSTEAAIIAVLRANIDPKTESLHMLHIGRPT